MGSVGGILGRADPNRLRKQLRNAEEKTESAQFEADVGNLIGQLLTDYNDRDTQGIQRILDRVKKELGDELDSTVDLRFGGSVAKRTYVDGLSDVDALALVDAKGAEVNSPSELRSLFAERLRAHYGRDNVQEGSLAVTVTVGDKTIQLLPALKEGDGFKISSSDGTHWSSIRPRMFAERLSAVNAAMGEKLVPTIKLVKAVIAAFPEQRRLTGYHVESMAVAVFDGYDSPKTPKAMVKHFFEKAPQCVRRPLPDPTGQSTYVDEYLGPADSTHRQVVADALDRVARKIRNADGAQSVARWRELLGGV